jgi:hypothetical protein
MVDERREGKVRSAIVFERSNVVAPQSSNDETGRAINSEDVPRNLLLTDAITQLHPKAFGTRRVVSRWWCGGGKVTDYHE